MANENLTQEYVRSLFEYAPETGVLTWKKRTLETVKSTSALASINARFAGKPAGFKHFTHIRVLIDGKGYYAHRVIWLYVYGFLPDNIDHIDGDGQNNRIINLRDVSHTDNMRNACQSVLNTSGITGVSSRKNGRWSAYITVDRKRIHLGVFADFMDAVSARKSAEEKYGFHENHGRKTA